MFVFRLCPYSYSIFSPAVPLVEHLQPILWVTPPTLLYIHKSGNLRSVSPRPGTSLGSSLDPIHPGLLSSSYSSVPSFGSSSLNSNIYPGVRASSPKPYGLPAAGNYALMGSTRPGTSLGDYSFPAVPRGPTLPSPYAGAKPANNSIYLPHPGNLPSVQHRRAASTSAFFGSSNTIPLPDPLAAIGPMTHSSQSRKTE